MSGCCLLNTRTFPDAPLLQLAAHLHCSKQSLLAVYSLPAACCCTAAEAFLAVLPLILLHSCAQADNVSCTGGWALSGVAVPVRLQ